MAARAGEGPGAVKHLDGPGARGLRAAIFREPLVTTSTARRRPRPAKQRRSEWRLARWIRKRRLAFYMCLLLAVPGVMAWTEKVLVHIHIEEPVEWDIRLAARATIDIADLLEVIGHGVTVSSVESREYNSEYAAAYYIEDRHVIVESALDFSDDTLLFLMGHECAHAMLVQSGFLKSDPGLAAYQDLAHEVAADVLGAHLAGRVVSRRGGDGASLTKYLIEETRIVGRIRPTGPEAVRGHNSSGWDGKTRTYVGNGRWLDPNYGSEKLINAIDRICRQNEDPWEAARTFAKEIHNVDINTAKRLAPAKVFREKPEQSDEK
jgi:hypothetical protein